MDEAFNWYLENKNTIDADIDRSLSYTYKAIDEFNDGGGKIISFIAQNSVLIDCKWLYKDLYDIIYELAMILEEKHLVLYMSLRPRLNQILVYIRDELSVCDYAPEINALLKEQPAYYLGEDKSLASIPELADKLLESFKRNPDGSINDKEVRVSAPIYTDMKNRELFFSL